MDLIPRHTILHIHTPGHTHIRCVIAALPPRTQAGSPAFLLPFSGAGSGSFLEALGEAPRPPPALRGLPIASEESVFSQAGFTIPAPRPAGAPPSGMSLQQTMLEHVAQSGVMRWT